MELKEPAESTCSQPPRNMGWWGLVLTVALLGSAAFAGYEMSRFFNSATSDNAGLEVDPAGLDFGEVWADQRFMWPITIRNQSSKPVEVVEFLTSCDCLSSEPQRLTLGPGDSQQVRLTIDLTRGGKSAADGGGARPYDVHVAPRLGEGMAQQTGWTICGRVRELWTATPRRLDYGEGVVRGQTAATRTIRLTPGVPISHAWAAWSGGVAAAHLSPPEKTKRHYELAAQLKACLPLGTLQGSVTVHAVGADGARLPDLTLPVQGEVMEVVGATPRRVQFGVVLVGGKESQVVALRSLVGRPFRVERIEVSAPEVRGEQVEAERGEVANSHSVLVSVSPTKGGLMRATLSVWVRLTGEAEAVKVQVPVSGWGKED